MRPIWSPRSENPLSLWLTRKAWEQHAEAKKVEIARETGADLPPPKKHAAGDPRTLRGIPVSGVPGGMGGTIADTNPLAVVLRKEAQAERRSSR